MAQTHDFGPFFWQSLPLKTGAPFIHRAATVEVEAPFRVAAPLVFHVWPGTGIAVGRWMDSDFDNEEDALFEATHVAGLDGESGRGGYRVATDETGDRLILS